MPSPCVSPGKKQSGEQVKFLGKNGKNVKIRVHSTSLTMLRFFFVSTFVFVSILMGLV